MDNFKHTKVDKNSIIMNLHVPITQLQKLSAMNSWSTFFHINLQPLPSLFILL